MTMRPDKVKNQVKQMTVGHDPAFDYHTVTFSWGGGDGVTVAVLGGDTVRVTESHDGGTVGSEYDEVPLAEFLSGLGIASFELARDQERPWYEE